MKLNARQVDAAKPREKAYKLADGAGLYLDGCSLWFQILADEISLQWKREAYGLWCLSGSVPCTSEGTA